MLCCGEFPGEVMGPSNVWKDMGLEHKNNTFFFGIWKVVMHGCAK